MIWMRLLPLLLLPALVLAGCGEDENDVTGSDGQGACTYNEAGSAAKEVDLPPSTPDPKNPTELTISTSAGDIPITLEPETAPCTVSSFVSLAKQKYFDGTTCHRLTTSETAKVLQCGDPTGTGTGGPGYEFADELVENDERLQPCDPGGAYCTYNTGVVAMANAGPDTNGSQFFLVYGNSLFPPDYTVLGHTDAEGLKVLNAIAAGGIDEAAANGPGDGPPKTPVTITSVQ